MYLEYYGLNAKPFSLIPDPAFLFLSSQHVLAYRKLEYALLEQKGITVITGEVGAGKTVLIQHLLNQYRSRDWVFGLISNTQEDIGKRLMKWVLFCFNIDPLRQEKDLSMQFRQFLNNNINEGKTTVLIIDEAQNLGIAALEQIRLLSKINGDANELFKIVLVAQPKLRQMLALNELAQFTPSITTDFHLTSLTPADTFAYIRHRLKVAGATSQIFSEAAMCAIYYLTGGIPRLVNTLCDACLLCGCSAGKRILEAEGVVDLVRERRIGLVNKFIEGSDDRIKVREFIRLSSGLDIAESID